MGKRHPVLVAVFKGTAPPPKKRNGMETWTDVAHQLAHMFILHTWMMLDSFQHENLEIGPLRWQGFSFGFPKTTNQKGVHRVEKLPTPVGYLSNLIGGCTNYLVSWGCQKMGFPPCHPVEFPVLWQIGTTDSNDLGAKRSFA